jgi:hypothetical protein
METGILLFGVSPLPEADFYRNWAGFIFALDFLLVGVIQVVAKHST